MANQKTYEIKDDELNVTATFDENHKPDTFRPHKIHRETVPMRAAIQARQRELGEPVTTGGPETFAWLMRKAGCQYQPEWSDTRALAIRQKSREAAKPAAQEAKADTEEAKIAEAVNVALLTLMHGDKKHKPMNELQASKKIAENMRAQNFSEEKILKYLPKLAPKQEAQSFNFLA